MDALSASKILAKARKASSTAKSVRIRGKFSDGGQTIKMDLRLGGTQGGTGYMVMNGQRIDLIRVKSSIYIKGDDAFWTAIGGEGAAQLFSGKYLKASVRNKNFAELSSFTLPTELFSEITKPDGSVTKGGHGRINGVPAIALEDGTGSKLYVATEGEPHVLRITAPKGTEHLDFLDYDKTVSVQAPPSNLVVDIDKLQGM